MHSKSTAVTRFL